MAPEYLEHCGGREGGRERERERERESRGERKRGREDRDRMRYHCRLLCNSKSPPPALRQYPITCSTSKTILVKCK